MLAPFDRSGGSILTTKEAKRVVESLWRIRNRYGKEKACKAWALLLQKRYYYLTARTEHPERSLGKPLQIEAVFVPGSADVVGRQGQSSDTTVFLRPGIAKAVMKARASTARFVGRVSSRRMCVAVQLSSEQLEEVPPGDVVVLLFNLVSEEHFLYEERGSGNDSQDSDLDADRFLFDMETHAWTFREQWIHYSLAEQSIRQRKSRTVGTPDNTMEPFAAGATRGIRTQFYRRETLFRMIGSHVGQQTCLVRTESRGQQPCTFTVVSSRLARHLGYPNVPTFRNSKLAVEVLAECARLLQSDRKTPKLCVFEHARPSRNQEFNESNLGNLDAEPDIQQTHRCNTVSFEDSLMDNSVFSVRSLHSYCLSSVRRALSTNSRLQSTDRVGALVSILAKKLSDITDSTVQVAILPWQNGAFSAKPKAASKGLNEKPDDVVTTQYSSITKDRPMTDPRTKRRRDDCACRYAATYQRLVCIQPLISAPSVTGAVRGVEEHEWLYEETLPYQEGLPGCAFELCVPIVLSGRTVGVLDVQFDQLPADRRKIDYLRNELSLILQDIAARISDTVNTLLINSRPTAVGLQRSLDDAVASLGIGSQTEIKEALIHLNRAFQRTSARVTWYPIGETPVPISSSETAPLDQHLVAFVTESGQQCVIETLDPTDVPVLRSKSSPQGEQHRYYRESDVYTFTRYYSAYAVIVRDATDQGEKNDSEFEFSTEAIHGVLIAESSSTNYFGEPERMILRSFSRSLGLVLSFQKSIYPSSVMRRMYEVANRTSAHLYNALRTSVRKYEVQRGKDALDAMRSGALRSRIRELDDTLTFFEEMLNFEEEGATFLANSRPRYFLAFCGISEILHWYRTSLMTCNLLRTLGVSQISALKAGSTKNFANYSSSAPSLSITIDSSVDQVSASLSEERAQIAVPSMSGARQAAFGIMANFARNSYRNSLRSLGKDVEITVSARNEDEFVVLRLLSNQVVGQERFNELAEDLLNCRFDGKEQTHHEGILEMKRSAAWLLAHSEDEFVREIVENRASDSSYAVGAADSPRLKYVLNEGRLGIEFTLAKGIDAVEISKNTTKLPLAEFAIIVDGDYWQSHLKHIGPGKRLLAYQAAGGDLEQLWKTYLLLCSQKNPPVRFEHPVVSSLPTDLKSRTFGHYLAIGHDHDFLEACRADVNCLAIADLSRYGSVVFASARAAKSWSWEGFGPALLSIFMRVWIADDGFPTELASAITKDCKRSFALADDSILEGVTAAEKGEIDVLFVHQRALREAGGKGRARQVAEVWRRLASTDCRVVVISGAGALPTQFEALRPNIRPLFRSELNALATNPQLCNKSGLLKMAGF